MQYIIEDKKKISFFMALLKSCLSNKTSISLMISVQHGWLIMQNQEHLHSLDASNLVLLIHLRNCFFSSYSSSGLQKITFEFDVLNLFKSLKGLNKSIKKITFQIKPDQQNINQAQLLCIINVDDTQIVMQRPIYINNQLQQNVYFQEMQDFTQEKNKYLEISDDYLKQIKEMQNVILEMKFYEDYMSIVSVNDPNSVQKVIFKQALSRYDFQILDEIFESRNRLLIPPNYLLPHINLANKLQMNMEMCFGEEIISDRVAVYCRTITDQCQIVTNFGSILEQDLQVSTQQKNEVYTIQQQQQQQPTA